VNDHDFPDPIPTIRWLDGAVRILDQRLLPRREVYRDLRTVGELIQAIRTLAVRGAPALGIAGAYGVALAAMEAIAEGKNPLSEARRCGAVLARSRPTAVNLSMGVERALHAVSHLDAVSDRGETAERLVEAGTALLEEDLESSRRMARYGLSLIPKGRPVLTHCNTGGLATAGLGTALAVIRHAAERGRIGEVFVDETRPLLQGGRLTLWELRRAGIEARLICEGAAAWTIRRFGVGSILVGADRIAANGDTANKVGTYGLALIAHAQQIPFFIVAPATTFDRSVPDGSAIPVEERSARELLSTSGWGRETGADAYTPAFDVPPADLISAWITDRGVVRPPFDRWL